MELKNLFNKPFPADGLQNSGFEIAVSAENERILQIIWGRMKY